ncbi:Gfo/Idh/MocA family protein [Desertihabitans aurantiacus]|uniref:Gfo/Idh/MocA family protein n=1 Tax=Desertihabitans aurantiacus TaxID=2282477 RepID=UPI000DF82BD0|nr:Gfo/Idh/MocA family oxidoreductase [Desertihabitans aurantiacus]
MTTRWGIASTGRMAGSFAADFSSATDAELVAVGSRDVARARAFADQHGIERAHGSYAELLADPDVDVVYVATPHPQHHRLALAAIEAGKPLLVEKAFTATFAGAQEVVDAARAADVFVMEALWTRFLPAVAKAQELIDDGAIGEVRAVQADLGSQRDFDPSDRLFSPALGGGATLDLGVYVINLAQQFLGIPTTVHAAGSTYPNGVDATVSYLLGFEDGRSAALSCSLESQTPSRAIIMGTGGHIELEPRFHHPSSLVLRPNTGDAQSFSLPPRGVGYGHQIDEVGQCLSLGLTESPTMPLADTLAVQAIMQASLDQLGVEVREDGSVQI